MTIKTISSRVVYQNRWMKLREDQIERADGSSGIYAVVEKAPAAIIIPIEDDSLYMVEQFRYSIGQRFLEFPQGAWELDPTAAPEALARGELREETGLEAEHIQNLGHIFIGYGMANQGMHVFRATGLKQGTANLELEEQDLIVKKVLIADFENMVRSGIVKDGCSISAWALHLMLPPKRSSE
jgi:8-oxo-dGTP pyrophosphatase MutT (NUDIX family)